MISNNGTILTRVVEDTSAQNLMPIIKENVKEKSTIYSDEWVAYRSLKENYYHEVVRHDMRKYVNGNATTNKMENYWSHLKRGIFGVIHKVSQKHLQYYLDAQSFRYMTRDISDYHRFNLFLHNMENRIKYKELTAS